MKNWKSRRMGGWLLAMGVVCGCDSARTPSPSTLPEQTSTARPSLPVKEEVIAARSDVAARPEPVVAAQVVWELNPPKSVTASKTIVPHDPGAVFMHYCSVCHGPEGRGDGQYYSDELASKPADLTNKPFMKGLSDEHLTTVITGGSTAVGKSPLCPPWGRVLSKEQVAELVVHLRDLASREVQETQDGED